MMDKQVTIRFESTVENNENLNEESMLLSGPIEIFATVDVLHSVENGNVIAHPTIEEERMDIYKITKSDVINNVYPGIDEDDINTFNIDKYSAISNNKIALQSQYVSKLVSQYFRETSKNIVIYVENVTDYKDQYRNRGAYFLYKPGATEDEVNWQEIAIGTHSHSNMDVLEELSELALEEKDNEKVLMFNKDGNLITKNISDLNNIPELPESIRREIEQLKYYESLNEPTESEWNHLDASLDKLDYTYDWMEKDENGNFKNLAVGNCRELYRTLLNTENKLYLDENYKLSDDKSLKQWISMDVYKVNFDTSVIVEDAINAKQFAIGSLSLKLTVNSFNITQNDEIFIFENGDLIDSKYKEAPYEIVSKDKKDINIVFDKSEFAKLGTTVITVLIVRDAAKEPLYRYNFAKAFKNGQVSLIEINNKLASLYIENEFNRKPVIPKLYLTTDSYGNMVWDNKLLPSQTFYTKTLKITPNNVVYTDEGDLVELVFEGANYRTKDDFPLLMVNDFFVFDAIYDVYNSSGDLVVYLPKNPDVAQYDFDFRDVDEFRKVTLVLVKNSAGQIVDELASKYVTKDDAIAILSHGKINLKDFVTKNDALRFSKIGHKHTQYALKEHNHDARYATFQHTHPEIIAAVITALNPKNGESLTDELNNLLKQIQDNNRYQLQAFINELGLIDNQISDMNVLVDQKVADDFIIKFKDTVGESSHNVGDKLRLSDVLEMTLILFDHDKVLDSQVMLEADIPVKLVNGPIGGLAENKTYKAGIDSLQTIIRDILNPYIDIKSMRRLLTPTTEDTILEWFVLDSSGHPYKIDLEHAPYFNEPKMLLFTVKLNNSINEFCKATVTVNNLETVLETEIHDIKVNGESCRLYTEDDYSFNTKYFIYDDSFEFDKDNYLDLYNVDILYKSNLEDDKIYDNYGMSPEEGDSKFTKLNPTNKYLTIEVNVRVDYPDFFYGQVDTPEDIERELQLENNEGSDKVWSGIGSGIDEYHISTSNGQCIFFAIEKTLYNNVKIFDCDWHANITKFFNELDHDVLLFGGIEYVVVYYESLDNNADLNISLQLTKKCEICN